MCSTLTVRNTCIIIYTDEQHVEESSVHVSASHIPIGADLDDENNIKCEIKWWAITAVQIIQ